jgi:type I restriction-modification system DNA methylase subunit
MNKEQLKKLEADLWSAADKLRANSDLKASEYAQRQGTRRETKISDIAIEQCGFYLPDSARYDTLLHLPEEKDIAKALKEAMQAIEEYKPELEGVLPKDEYAALTRTDKTLPQQLLRTFADIPADASGDLFGQIYEYFLSEFARSEGQKGGEFFTPRSVVRLMVEIIEPHGGKVYDPACGSGGMFVQSAQFIAEHRKELPGANSDVYVYGQEKRVTMSTWPIRRSTSTTWACPASRKTSASTPTASRATNRKSKKPTKARKPSPTATTCGSTCSPPRSKRKAAPHWSWPTRRPTRATPKPTPARR